MTLDEAKNLEEGTVIWDKHYSSCQILKRVSNGYIIFGYEDAHYVYYIDFLSFDDIVEREFEKTLEEYEIDIFNGDEIKHIERYDSYIPTYRDE